MSNQTIQVLIVEQDRQESEKIIQILSLSKISIEATKTDNSRKALRLLTQGSFDAVLLDAHFSHHQSLLLIQQLQSLSLLLPVIVLAKAGNEETAVEFMKVGATDYLPKSKLSPESLSRALQNAVRVYRAEQKVIDAHQKLLDSKERYRLILEDANLGIWDWDLLNQELYGSQKILQILGLTPDSFPLKSLGVYRLLHPQDRWRVKKAITQYLSLPSPLHFPLELEFRLRHASGQYHHCLVRGTAHQNAQGQPIQMSGMINDVTEQQQTEARSRFLAQVSTLLSSPLDVQTTLENVAWLAVPHLADWCIIDLFDEATQSYHRLAASHVNPAKEPLLWKLSSSPVVADPDKFHCPGLRIGLLDVCFEVSAAVLPQIAVDEEQFRLLRQLNLCSYILTPLQVGDQFLGKIWLVYGDSGRYYTKADLNLVRDLARRTAWALENTRLYRKSQKVSASLRKAVLSLEEQQQQLHTLQQLTNLLNQRLTNLPDLLRGMAQAVYEAIDNVQVCLITLFNPNCDQMVFTITAGINTDKLCLEEQWSKTWLHQIFVTGEPQLIQENPQEQESPLPAALYGVAIESLQSGRLGVLAIGNWEHCQEFDPGDQELLSAVAEQAAIAIDNARLIKTLENREERLEAQNLILAQQNQELETQRQQIQVQNQQLRVAARMKSQFLATMSHELRTPMNAILGFSQLLLQTSRGDWTNQHREMSKRILSNGQHLLGLINNVLDLSRMEAGGLVLQPKRFNLVHLIGATLNELQSLADENKLSLSFDSTLDNPQVFHDSDRLRQILVNLLSNAIKFTEEGQVLVKLQPLSPTHLQIVVQDTGIGMNETQLKFIFQEFWQGDQSTTRKYSGTGLGLAITRSLVHLMEGKIWVESQLNQGSTFYVELPWQVQGNTSIVATSAWLEKGKVEDQTSNNPNSRKEDLPEVK